jgi:spore coat protein CotH
MKERFRNSTSFTCATLAGCTHIAKSHLGSTTRIDITDSVKRSIPLLTTWGLKRIQEKWQFGGMTVVEI